MSIGSVRNSGLRWIPVLISLFALLLAGSHAWTAASNYSMNPDGISYLDMGEAYVQGDWRMAINAYWSPFYAWLLGLGLLLLKPTMRWEFPVVQLINFLVFLGALVGFSFFWRELTRFKRGLQGTSELSGVIMIPDWAWLGLGYALFTYTSLNLIKIWSVTPDMLVALFVFLAAGLVIHIRAGDRRRLSFFSLGIVLGLGYLAKAPLFLLSILFLLFVFISMSDFRKSIPLIFIATSGFLMIAGPLIFALTQVVGYPTFGESGKLNYARYVNGLPDAHWQGDSPENGEPVHPTRIILEHPAVYEFGTPIGGTYPPWYDPTYWYEGMVLHYDWKEQTGVLLANAVFYYDLFLREQGVFLAGVLILLVAGGKQLYGYGDHWRNWGLLWVSLVAFSMYALVYVETRYLAPFIVLFWTEWLLRIRLPDTLPYRRLIVAVSAMMLFSVFANIVIFNLEGFRDLTGDARNRRYQSEETRSPSWPGEVAEELHRMGVKPGDRVAVIGYGFNSFWARLAKVKIVAEMLEGDALQFWEAAPGIQVQVLKAFATTGAMAVVAENVPGYARLPGWQQVGETNYFIYPLFSK